LRVLVVSHACVVDANQTIYRWIEQLPDIELQIIAPQMWPGDAGAVLRFQRLSTLRSPIVALRAVFGGRGSLHFYPGAAACVAAFKPDLIFLDEEPWSFCALQFAVLARRAGARLVFYTKENLPRRYPLPFRRIEQFVFTRTSAAAVISDEATAVLRAKGYSGPTVTLPHGFESDWFQPRDRPGRCRELNLSGVVIGYVGRLAPEKGIADLIEAARLIRDVQPGTAFHLLIIGSGPEESTLKELVAQHGLNQAVTFVPNVPHNQIAEYYNCLDVLVVPSRTTPGWKEQFGRVLVEAMASGVCVIGSDSGEIPTVIGDDGLVFREGDSEDLAAALRRVISDNDLRRQLGERGRVRAVRNFDNSVIARQLLCVWRNATDGDHVTD
jgi:glycosyltransferase involved in cell wall biosynthesis